MVKCVVGVKKSVCYKWKSFEIHRADQHSYSTMIFRCFTFVQPPSSSIRQVHSFFMVEHILILGFCFVSHASGMCSGWVSLSLSVCTCFISDSRSCYFPAFAAMAAIDFLSLGISVNPKSYKQKFSFGMNSMMCFGPHTLKSFILFSFLPLPSLTHSLYLKSREHMESEGISQPKCLGIYVGI